MTVKKNLKEMVYEANKGTFREVTEEEKRKFEERLRRKTHGVSIGQADWREADVSLIQQALCAITARGYAFQLGYTRDGGAYYIRIVGTDPAIAIYVRPNEGIDEKLKELVHDFAEQ